MIVWALAAVVTLAPGLGLECLALDRHVTTIAHRTATSPPGAIPCSIGPRHGDQLEVFTPAPAPGHVVIFAVRSVDPPSGAVSEWFGGP